MFFGMSKLRVRSYSGIDHHDITDARLIFALDHGTGKKNARVSTLLPLAASATFVLAAHPKTGASSPWLLNDKVVLDKGELML